MIWLAIILVVLMDMQHLASKRFIKRNVLPLGLAGKRDITVLVPVYGHESYFKSREHLSPIKDHVLMVLGGLPEFAQELRNDGWNVHEVEGGNTLLGLLQEGIKHVKTKYVIRLDADTTFDNLSDVFSACTTMLAHRVDLASVRVNAVGGESLVVQLQELEYKMSMLGRRISPWLTSGACMVANTKSYEEILSHHSHHFPGEDLEIGLIAKHFGMKVKHLNMLVHTVAPDTWKELFNQRKLWWAGAFRHSVVNFEHNLRRPIWLLYTFGLVWAMWLLKIDLSVETLKTIPLVILLYIGITLVANWEVRSPLMVIFPFYSLVQVLVLPPLGLVKYVQTVWRLKSFGRYHFGLLKPRS